MRPAVFLDRDDTLIECRALPAPPLPARPGDLIDPARVRLLPGVAPALARLRRAGFLLVVVSNQGVVARGGATCETVETVNRRLADLLEAAGGPRPDASYFCPYHPQGAVPAFTREHPWRKPGPGMLLAAADELSIDLHASWLIGDAARDVQAGIAAGLVPARCLLIGDEAPFASVDDAAEHILASAGPGRLVQGVPVARLTLRTPEPAWLGEPRTSASVLAAARALAERNGLALPELSIDDGALHIGLTADRLVALGFLAELRRMTNAWHQARHGVHLWPGDEPPDPHADPQTDPDDTP